MCLDNFLSYEEKKDITDSIPEDGLKVYKVVEVGKVSGRYWPLFMSCSYSEGLNEARGVRIFSGKFRGYWSGFHFFKTKSDAEAMKKYFTKNDKIGKTFKVIECIVEKYWISEIGTEISYSTSWFDLLFRFKRKSVVIVAEKAIFPKIEK